MGIESVRAKWAREAVGAAGCAYLALSYGVLWRYTAWPWIGSTALWLAIGGVLVIAGSMFLALAGGSRLHAPAIAVCIASTAALSGYVLYSGAKMVLPLLAAMIVVSPFTEVHRFGRAMGRAALSSDRTDVAVRRVTRCLVHTYLGRTRREGAVTLAYNTANDWTQSYRRASPPKRFLMRAVCAFSMRRDLFSEETLVAMRRLENE